VNRKGQLGTTSEKGTESHLKVGTYVAPMVKCG